MNTHIELVLDTRRKKKDNTFPIVLRITHFRKSTSIFTGYSVCENDWDFNLKGIKKNKNDSSLKLINNILLKSKVEAQDIINRLNDTDELNYLSLIEIKERINNKKTRFESFFEFGEQQIKELKASKRFGTARSYRSLLGILKVFRKQKDLRFNEINPYFLKRFEDFHLSKNGNTVNGLAAYMRTLRAIYNKGVKSGIISRDKYPFDLYKIRTTATEKRAIDIEQIKRIMHLELTPENTLFNYRNYFLLSYFLYGMSFIDLAFLKVENIRDHRIKFQRKKTGKRYDIKMTEQVSTIMRHYLELLH
jgi:integrase/recombinase XerD